MERDMTHELSQLVILGTTAFPNQVPMHARNRRASVAQRTR
jgi:hypothetical protein